MKNKNWAAEMSKYSRITDRLGKRIDPEILETVVALNMVGITTVASCAGHLDHGLPYPWVDVGSKSINEYYGTERQVNKIYAAALSSLDDTTHDDLIRVSKKMSEENYIRFRTEYLSIFEKLTQLVKKFNENNKSARCVMVVVDHGISGRIMVDNSVESQKSDLADCRRCMVEFGEYVVSKG